MTQTSGSFRNLGPSEKHERPGGNVQWWQAEVADATGRFFLLSGVWAKSREDAEKRFAQTASNWSTYTHPSDEEYAEQMDSLRRDIATWGCE